MTAPPPATSSSRSWRPSPFRKGYPEPEGSNPLRSSPPRHAGRSARPQARPGGENRTTINRRTSLMPRTPLLRKFQALFEDFEEAERSGRSVEAVQAERRQMRLTRRDFLKATGATVGAAALAGPMPALPAAHLHHTG